MCLPMLAAGAAAGASTMSASAALAAATGGYAGSMASLGLAGASSVGIGTILSAGSSAISAISSYQQGKANARLAKQQAVDAQRRGSEEEQRQRSRVAAMKGAQRAKYAANGVLVDEGAALDTIEETAAIGEMDALTIRDNASREAWGYRSEASIQRSAGTSGAMASLLTGAGKVADKWYRQSSLIT